MSSITRGLKKLRLSRKKKDDSKGSAQGSSAKGESNDNKDSRRIRKRLSITDADGTGSLLLDGVAQGDHKNGKVSSAKAVKSTSSAYKEYALESNVGLVPFNPNKVNQDRAMVVDTLFGATDNGLFGVFDGHGIHGDDVSTFLKDRMPVLLKDLQSRFLKDPNAGLKTLFEITGRALAKSSVNCTFSGSTATVSFVTESQIWTANAGDSRAVLGRLAKGTTDADAKWDAVALSFDHKPDNKEEQKRIEKANGRVEPCKGPLGDYIGPARVWLKTQEMPGLAMSRSFGDDVAAGVGVTHEAEVVEYTRTKQDRCIVMGSDGIWEFIENQEAIDMVSKFTDADKACKALSEEATKRWQMEEEVIDDITCVVVFF